MAEDKTDLAIKVFGWVVITLLMALIVVIIVGAIVAIGTYIKEGI